MKALYKKELGHYFNNPIGFIVVVLFALFSNFLFIKDIFTIGSASMRPFFVTSGWMLIVFVPALTMRCFAEEKRTNTLEPLLTLPVRERDIVFAKLLAVLTVIAIGLSLTLALPVALAVISTLYLPEVLMGYIGLFLMATSFAAVSMIFSLKTNNQIVSFFLSAVTLFFLIAFSSDFVASFIPREISDLLTFITPLPYLDPFMKGLLDIRSVLYFLMITGLFTYITTTELEERS